MILKHVKPLATAFTGIAMFALSLGGAQAADLAPPQPNLDKPVAVVNGTTLTNADLLFFARAISATRGQQMPKEEVMNTLIDRELLYQEALAKGYDKRPEIIRDLANQRRSLLANVTVNELLRSKPITDDELRKVYKERVLSQKMNEYKARHILVKTEGEAKDIIAQLDKGGDFSALAKSKSIDKASAEHGGDLGWFAPTQMVPEFSKAAAALQKGKYTETPVKSRFGWHIIMLDDVRPVAPPKFKDIKQRLEGVVQNQRLTEYLNELHKKSKIEMK